MRILRGLRVCLWRHLVVKKRNFGGLLLDLLLPCFLFLILSLLNALFGEHFGLKEHKERRLSAVTLLEYGCLGMPSFKTGTRIYFSPNTSEAAGLIMAMVWAWTNQICSNRQLCNTKLFINMNGNSTQNPKITSPDLLDLKLCPKDPLYNFGSKIRDTDNEVFFTDSHVCSCSWSCHWGGDRGDYFVNTILSSTKSKSFFNYPGPCKWKQLRQEPRQTYRGGRGRFSGTGLPLHCVTFFAKFFFFQIHRS